MTAFNEPIRLLPAQREEAAQVLARAFLDDPGYKFVFPEFEERARSLAAYGNAVLDYSMHFGRVYTTPALCGIACWLPSGRLLSAIRALVMTRFATYRAMLGFSKESQTRFVALGRYSEEVKKRVAPKQHLLLGFLAVDPAAQGHGLGSRLLVEGLQFCDARGLPCYLDTATESNLAFYAKHGFEVVHAGEIPGGGPSIWGMLRMPRNNRRRFWQSRKNQQA